MFHELSYRVPYADTDQMGVVYYANYLVYFERGRTEMLRDCGLPYSELEKLGLILPVREAHCTYYASAHYDELITICTAVGSIRGPKLEIVSEVRCDGKLLVAGSVMLICVNPARKIIRPTAALLAACEKYRMEANK